MDNLGVLKITMARILCDDVDGGMRYSASWDELTFHEKREYLDEIDQLLQARTNVLKLAVVYRNPTNPVYQRLYDAGFRELAN